MSSSEDDSTAGDHRDGRRRHACGDAVEVGAGQLAVALDVGDHERRRCREAPQAIGERSGDADVQPWTATTPRR